MVSHSTAPDAEGPSWIGRDLPPIEREGRDYFLLCHCGSLYLVENACPHRGGPLKFGWLDDQMRVVCPMHHNAYPIEALIRRLTTIRLSEGTRP